MLNGDPISQSVTLITGLATLRGGRRRRPLHVSPARVLTPCYIPGSWPTTATTATFSYYTWLHQVEVGDTNAP